MPLKLELATQFKACCPRHCLPGPSCGELGAGAETRASRMKRPWNRRLQRRGSITAKHPSEQSCQQRSLCSLGAGS